MRKSLLTAFVVLIFSSTAFAASTSGRVRMTVVRTNVQPAAVIVITNEVKKVTATTGPTQSVVEVIY